MRIKVNNGARFQTENCYYFSELQIFEDELEVYAISGKRNKVALLFIDNRYLGFFKLNPKYITIIDDKIDDTWTYKKRYRYNGSDNEISPEMVTLKLNDLYAPDWMFNEKGFFYLVYMNNRLAMDIFRSNT